MRRSAAAAVLSAISLLSVGLIAGPASAAPAQESLPAVCAPLGELIDNARKAPFDDAAYAEQVATADALLDEIGPLAADELNALLDNLEALTAEVEEAVAEAAGVVNLTVEQRDDFRDRADAVLEPLVSYQTENCSPDISDITLTYVPSSCPTAADSDPGPMLTITNARDTGDAEVVYGQAVATVPASDELVITEGVERALTSADFFVDGVSLPEAQLAIINVSCLPVTTSSAPSSADDAPPSAAQPAPLTPRFTG